VTVLSTALTIVPTILIEAMAVIDTMATTIAYSTNP
jgi:hypothetical protein